MTVVSCTEETVQTHRTILVDVEGGLRVLQLVQSRPLAHFRLKPRLQWRYVAAAYKAFLDKFYNALLATNVPPWTSACMHPLKMVTKLEHSFQKQFRTGVIHQTWLTLHSGMIRVGPNRMTVYTPYPRYAVYPVAYMTLSHRFRNRMTEYGFQQAVYIRRVYGHIRRIYGENRI